MFDSQQSNISHIKWLTVCDSVTDLGRLHPATQLRVHSSGINAACHSDFYLIDHNRDGFCGMVVGNSWGDLLGTVLPPQVGTRMANRLCWT